MKFDHLLHINDLLSPRIKPITRTQLWRGLVLRAQAPGLFMPWLDECDLVAKSPAILKRVLHYGEVKIHDVVTFLPESEIRYNVAAQSDVPASQLVVRIEEPDHERLNVRFSYDDSLQEVPGSLEAFYNAYRRSAYEESDIDTIRIIRQLAEEGRFDLPL